MLIYKVTNLIDNKIYIGQTTQSLTERWQQHCHRSPSQTYKSHLHSAIQKYGKEHFLIEILDKTETLEELNRLEIFYIQQFDCLSPKGYNLLRGGLNKICHPETRLKISQKLKGRPITNRWNNGNHNPCTEITKQKIKQTMTGMPQPWKFKPVIVIETGIIYESVQSVAKELGIGRTIVSTLLKTGKTHKKTNSTFKFAA